MDSTYYALGCHDILITMSQFQLRVRSGDLASRAPPTDSCISKSTQDRIPNDRGLICCSLL
jgi:hypothetical protein